MAISQVVAAKLDGSEYNTIPPNVAGSGSVKNGGVVARVSVGVTRYNNDVFGSTVVDTNDVDKALTVLGSSLAYNNQKPVAKRYTTLLNGVVINNCLQSGAARPELVESIHSIKICTMGCGGGVRTRQTSTAFRENKFNRYTGQFDNGYPNVSTDYFDADNAVNITRVSPGSLTFKSSGLVPVNGVYQSKNS